MNHWIIAPIVLPAVLAALMLLALRGNLARQRLVSLGGVLALNTIAVALLLSATAQGPEAYFLGDWPAPFGIILVLDRLSALMVALLAALALPVTAYAVGSGWDARGAHFHPLLHFLLMGIAGAFLTGDAFNLFVFFEVLLIASYGLMVHGGGAARIRAGLQYVAFNLVGSALFLIALGLLYSTTGTLNMADLALKLPSLPPGDAALLRVSAVMLILVFAIKGALVPLHLWLPATYANAPGVVAALFAIMTKVGAYATLRFATLVFPHDLPATGLILPTLLLPAALVTLGIGALGVLGATTLPRLAAFAQGQFKLPQPRQGLTQAGNLVERDGQNMGQIAGPLIAVDLDGSLDCGHGVGLVLLTFDIQLSRGTRERSLSIGAPGSVLKGRSP